MLTIENTITEVAPLVDTDAAPLTTDEANALLSLSAGTERKPRVRAGAAVDRHWQRQGQVD